jgi:hypothetical protein
VAAELVESAAGEEESWPAMAVDIVKKMKEIKRCDIMGFLSLGLPLVGAEKRRQNSALAASAGVKYLSYLN